LRGNYQDSVLNDAAFDYLKERRGDPAMVAGLRTPEPQRFCNQVPFMTHLADKGMISLTGRRLLPRPACGAPSAIMAWWATW
jgi:hypothetical protein